MSEGMAERVARRDPVEWVLRIGVFLCFVGHGAFGVLRKPAWLVYFDALGIPPDAAGTLMPLVGMLDISVGVAALLLPLPGVLAWATLWALATALLRPLAGEPVWEVLERAGNYGVPLALLLLVVGQRRDRARTRRNPWLAPSLQAATVLLLLGHGALALQGKPLLVEHVAAFGLAPGATRVMGAIDIALALVVALRPLPAFLVGVAVWKVGSELAFPLAGAPVWEFVERGGSYAAPLALALLVGRGRAPARPLWRLPAATPRLAALAVLVGAAVAVPQGVHGQQRGQEPEWAHVARAVPDDAGLRTLAPVLRGGGLTLFCRHAITDHEATDRGSAREQQRNLDAAGRAQSQRMGRAMVAAAIPVRDVWASPMFRTMDTGELAFGRVKADARLRGSEREDDLRRLLSERPEGVRVLVSHQGTIRRVVAIGRSPLEEGDCLVLRPDDDGFEVLARLGADDWERLPRP